MHPATQDNNRVPLRHALAGLEAGVSGSLVMLGFLMLGSIWLRRTIWSFPNLMAMVFASPDAYRNEFTKTSLGGAALVVVIYGLLGAMWGEIWKDREPRFRLAAGAATGLAIYFLLFELILKHLRPLIGLYAPDRQLQVAHLLWGMLLTRSSHFASLLSGRRAVLLPPPLPASAMPVKALPPHDVPDVSNGEIIR